MNVPPCSDLQTDVYPGFCPPADILVYINDSCVLGRSHKEVVEMLKSVPMGQSVDVVLRRGYPMLYNPDGCPKQSLETVRLRCSATVPLLCYDFHSQYHDDLLLLPFSAATDSQ